MLIWHDEVKEKQHLGKHFERNLAKENSRKVLGSSTSMSTDEELALSNLVSDYNESIQTSMDGSCESDEFTHSS